MNGKYAPLYEHIRNLDERGCRDWHTTFTEIEKVIGDSLPPSARDCRQWWENSKEESRHSRAWMKLGWETHNVNFAKETVSFIRMN